MEDEDWNCFLQDAKNEFKQVTEDNSSNPNSDGSDIVSYHYRIILEKTNSAHQVATEDERESFGRGKGQGLAQKCVPIAKPASAKKLKVGRSSKQKSPSNVENRRSNKNACSKSKIKENKLIENKAASHHHKTVKAVRVHKDHFQDTSRMIMDLEDRQQGTVKVKVSLYTDPEDNTESLIIDLTNKHLVEEFEDFIKNNPSLGERISPETKASSISTAETQTSAGLQYKEGKKNFKKDFRKPKEGIQEHIKSQDSMSQALWEERSRYHPDLRPERILGVTTDPGELHFIVEWDGDRWLVRAEDAYRRFPRKCLKFYESLLVWN